MSEKIIIKEKMFHPCLGLVKYDLSYLYYLFRFFLINKSLNSGTRFFFFFLDNYNAWSFDQNICSLYRHV